MDISREAILKAQDLKREKIEVKEWGGDIWIRELTGREYIKFSELFDASAVQKGKGKINGAASALPLLDVARVVCWSVCDAKGRRLLQDTDAKALTEKNFTVVNGIFMRVLKLSGLTAEAVESAAGK